MEQTMIISTPALNSMTAMMPPTMLAKDTSPTPDALKTLPAYSTSALWATAVWGTKPASDPTLELPSLWDSSAVRTLNTRGCSEWTSPLNAATATFLRETAKTARYGDN